MDVRDRLSNHTVGSGKFSIHGSPAFEDRMQEIISHVVEEFLHAVPGNNIAALILGGGYGRGEGGVLKQNGQEAPYNDLDFFIFTNKLNYLRRKCLSNILNRLHNELSQKHQIDIDFSPAINIKRLPNLTISLMLFDLKQGHRVVYGKPYLLSSLPAWKAEDLVIPEALRLLLNRGLGLLFARDRLELVSAEAHTDFINRNIFKALQAIVEAILISEGRYSSSLIDRRVALAKCELDKYSNLPALEQEILKAMDFKLLPYVPGFDESELRSRLDYAVAAIRDIYYVLWSKFTEEKIADYRSLSEAISGIKDRDRLKNVAQNIRDRGFIRGVPRSFLRHPRYRLYQALPYFLFSEPVAPAAIAQCLGCSKDTNPMTLKDCFVRLWQRYN